MANEPPIYSLQPLARMREVKKVCTLLEREYGKPRFGNPKNPLDDLIYIILSNRTLPFSARRTYNELKRSAHQWESLLSMKVGNIKKILKPSGLSTVKSRQIYGALKKIHDDFGRCSLNALKKKNSVEVESYLISLPGVSKKVAKCVMMYTMGFEVLPVDVHVHRIARRLGWTLRNRADQCHEELESLISPSLRYVFHVGCIAHGRKRCFSNHPDCLSCCLNVHCIYCRSNT